jgi:hypothetical protein
MPCKAKQVATSRTYTVVITRIYKTLNNPKGLAFPTRKAQQQQQKLCGCSKLYR